jgi:hypothetical protein
MLKNVEIALPTKKDLCTFLQVGSLKFAALTALAEYVVVPSNISTIQIL